MQNDKISFAYKKAFQRTWFVLSFIWIASIVAFWFNDDSAASVIMLVGVLPCVILYAIGSVLAWIIEGFAKPE